MIEEARPAAIRSGSPSGAAGSMIVDIGGGTTDIAVIRGGIVYSKAVRVAATR